MPQPTIPLTLLALALGGCATLAPHSGVPATGDPLSVESSTRRWKETHSEKVGESDHYNSDGDYVGTSEQYENKTVNKSSFHWRPRQGDAYISDEDLFRIAGDTAKADAARRYRRVGVLMTVGGSLAFVGGTTVALVGALGGASGNQALGMYIGGASLASAGGLSAAFGFKRLTIEGHPHGIGEAKDAAQRYNQSLGVEPQALMRPAGRSVLVNVVSGRF